MYTFAFREVSGTSGAPSVGLLKCLQDEFGFHVPHKISMPKRGESLPKIETYGAFSKPVFVVGPESGLLLQPETSNNGDRKFSKFKKHTTIEYLVEQLMKKGYENDLLRWQFASSGGKELPALANAQDAGNFVKFREAILRMKDQEENVNRNLREDKNTNLHPSFFSKPFAPSSCSLEIMSLLSRSGNSNSTPLYAISSTTGLMDIFHKLETVHKKRPRKRKAAYRTLEPPSFIESLDNNQNSAEARRLARLKRMQYRAQRRKLKQHIKQQSEDTSMIKKSRSVSPTEFIDAVSDRKSEFMDRLLKDHRLSFELPLGLSSAVTMKGHEVSPHGIDFYVGMAMSGSHLHAHGPAVSSSSGRKLWMIYSPTVQCELETAAGVSLLAAAGLPPICTRESDDMVTFDKRNKFHPDSKLCLGQLHPVEVLYKLGHLDESVRPILVVQEPGEIMILPGRWLHMTVNIDKLFTVSYRYDHPPPRKLGCPVRDIRTKDWKTDL